MHTFQTSKCSNTRQAYFDCTLVSPVLFQCVRLVIEVWDHNTTSPNAFLGHVVIKHLGTVELPLYVDEPLQPREGDSLVEGQRVLIHIATHLTRQ